MIKFFTHLLPTQLSINMKSFVALSTELTDYAAFSRGNLAVETLSKTVSTTQDRAKRRKCERLLTRGKCLECPVAVHALLSNYL